METTENMHDTDQPGRGKRASIYTLGCSLNQSESNLLVNALRNAGYEIVPFGQPADLGIVNTCTVTGRADAKSRHMVRSFIRKNPHAFTAVIGCYSQMGYKQLMEIEGLDLIVGNQEKLNVLAYVGEAKNPEPRLVRDRIERKDFTIGVNAGESPVTRPNLKIQEGCDFMCAFCIVSFARGRARSRSFDNLITEAERLAESGAREIVLTGVNVGMYNHEGRDITAVLDALDAIPGIDRLRVSSLEPSTIPEAMLERMADPGHGLLPYLHIPVQSGSDRVLTLMKRHYTRAEYVAFVERAAREVPDLCLGADVLVGMPGETEADFEATCDLLRHSPIAYAHVFTYSDRPGTASSRYSDKVNTETINRRGAVARGISKEKRQAFRESQVGSVQSVLLEYDNDGVWFGYTGNYLWTAVRFKEGYRNTIVPVRLEEAREDYVTGSIHETRYAGAI